MYYIHKNCYLWISFAHFRPHSFAPGSFDPRPIRGIPPRRGSCRWTWRPAWDWRHGRRKPVMGPRSYHNNNDHLYDTIYITRIDVLYIYYTNNDTIMIHN